MAPSSLGWVGVVVGDGGLRAVALGDSRAEVAEALGASEATTAAPRELEGVLAVVEAPWTAITAPLPPGGTPFQRRVWAALRAIPAGETLSYGQLATALGVPGAARAVAGACAANPLAVVVPCHRVVGADGRLAGYRWGVGRKRALLEKERAHARGGQASEAASLRCPKGQGDLYWSAGRDDTTAQQGKTWQATLGSTTNLDSERS